MLFSKEPDAGMTERVARVLARKVGRESDWEAHVGTVQEIMREMRTPDKGTVEVARQCVPARVNVVGVWELLIDLTLYEEDLEEQEPPRPHLRLVGT
ncbi:MAG: hypothetical protein AAF441_16080 [Pseudomonadota bacterium]